jgi:DNA-directed RNA polymerase specialized sigma24 family protein
VAFDDAADRLATAAAHHDDASLTGSDLGTLMLGLERIVHASAPSLTRSDAEEGAAAALALFVDAASRGLVDLERPAAPYLTTVARNVAYKRARSAVRETADDDPVRCVENIGADEEDAVIALLDAYADRALVQAGLSAAYESGDYVLVRVVTVWLRLAEEMGDRPASRTVAAAAGVSHTTVQDTLERFKAYLPGNRSCG